MASSKNIQKETRQLNTRFLVISLLVLGVLLGGGLLWKNWQTTNIAGALVERADQLEEEGEWEEAAGYLHRYLKLRPDDEQVQVRLAETFDLSRADDQDKTRSIELYYRAVGLEPNRAELRERLAELLLEAKRFEQSSQEADRLLKEDSESATGKRVKALARLAQNKGQDQTAIEETTVLLDVANRALPQDAQVAESLAGLYRDHQRGLKAKERKGRDVRANRVMDALVAAAPEDAEAWLARFRYRQKYKLAGVPDDLQKALSVAPGDLGVLLAAADYARSTNDLGQAKSLYLRATKLEPSNSRGYLGLGDVAVAEDSVEEAIAAWRNGLQKVETNPVMLHLRLAGALIDAGRLEEAEKDLDSLDRLAAQMAGHATRDSQLLLKSESDLWRAKWHFARGEDPQAIELLKRVTVTVDIDEETGRYGARRLQAWLLLGAAYARQSQWDAAGSAFDSAVALSPNLTAARINAGRAWANAGRYDMASRRFEAAENRGEVPSDLWTRKLNAQLREQGRRVASARDWDKFDASFERAEKSGVSRGELVLLQANMASLRGEAKTRDAAIEAMRLAEKGDSVSADWLQRATLIYQSLGRRQDAERAFAAYQKASGNSALANVLRSKMLLKERKANQARQILLGALEEAKVEDDRVAILDQLLHVERALGDKESAGTYLKQLAELKPGDIQTICDLADLALETNSLDDLRHWESALLALEGNEGTCWQYYKARRLLVEADGPGDSRVTEAVKLQSSIESRRPYWPSSRVLEGLIAEVQGKSPQAILAYQSAIKIGENRLGVYERLIRLLYQSERFDDAKRHLEQVQQHVSRSPEVFALGVAVATSSRDQEFAEKWYRRLLQQSPHRYEPLVRWLVIHDRTSEAVQVCRDYYDHQLGGRPESRCAAKVAIILAEVMIYGSPTEADTEAVDAIFKPVVEKHADESELLFAVASVRLKQQRTEECIDLFKRVTEIDPENVLAWNNLAVVVGEQSGRAEEALGYIEQAKQAAGSELPVLIDTEAVILLALNRPEEAAKLLEPIVVGQDAVDPRNCLHLASAYQKLGRNEDAAQWLTKAESLGLDKTYLTQSEQDSLAKLKGESQEEPVILEEKNLAPNVPSEKTTQTPSPQGAGVAKSLNP